MTIYSIYVPPLGDVRSADFRMVPDKKSPWALIAPVVWLAYHRLWLALLAYVVFSAAVLLFLSTNPHIAFLYLSALPGLYLLLEGQELVRGKLERADWQFVGVVEGESAEEAETRWALSSNHDAGSADFVVAHEVAPAKQRSPGFHTRPNNGLFPE